MTAGGAFVWTRANVTLSVRQTWAWALTLQLTRCVVLDELPDLAGSQFPCLSNQAYFSDS